MPPDFSDISDPFRWLAVARPFADKILDTLKFSFLGI
jgi:hypothetical protein